MRKSFNPQLQFGQVPIEKIRIDLKSRDDIPQLLLGLQHIYTQKNIFTQVISILENNISPDKKHDNGRPGMDLWKILIFGVLRLNLNWDYDRLLEMANNHKTIREMLGHGMKDKDHEYKLQTLKDNVQLLTPELLGEINQIVVLEGHNLVKNEEQELKGRCDSFVVETNVHYPTDINLLFDATRKIITLTALLCSILGIAGWRQSSNNLRKVKKLFTLARKLKKSTSKKSDVVKKREKEIKEAHQEYIDGVLIYLEKVNKTIADITDGGLESLKKVAEIQMYINHAYRQIDQIGRRVIDGEKIPNNEKVFSIFEEHTEWISKGKAGVPVELGLKVCILEDQFGFILHHRVMQDQTDDQLAVSIVKESKCKFDELTTCSFDKGFHSPKNQVGLREILDFVVLPKKGKLSIEDKKHQYSDKFIELRHKHSAVESGINALEVHGLDRCPDRGLESFNRYVALAVLGRNFQKLGAIILQNIRSDKQKLKLKKAA